MPLKNGKNEKNQKINIFFVPNISSICVRYGVGMMVWKFIIMSQTFLYCRVACIRVGCFHDGIPFGSGVELSAICQTVECSNRSGGAAHMTI